MRMAQKRNSGIESIPAPIMGWNVRDPLPSMAKEYAPILDNFFCLPSEIQVRKGYTRFATGFDGWCETLVEYSPLDGNQKLFACVDNGNIYDVTAGGVVGAAVVTGLTSAQFKYINFANSGGSFGYYINGADSPRLYDGTTWHAVTGVSAPYAITGVTTSILKDVIVHKRRIWFVQKDSMNCWYLDTDAISGAATKYDFSPIFSRGGFIVKIDTWSLDAGVGLDDYFVIYTSEGEVAVYKGTDPSSASTWSLSGVFYIGPPVGNGHTLKYGGDALIINRDGIAQLSKQLMSSRVNTKLQLTDKIQPQLAADTTKYSGNIGWDMILFPPENMLIVNIPVDVSSVQYVMNTISGAWSRWTGLNAKSWIFHNEKIYFGGRDFVGLAWDGYADNGTAITAEALPAFNYYGARSRLKKFLMARPVFGSEVQMSYGVQVVTDFKLDPPYIPIPFSPAVRDAIYGETEYGNSVYAGGLSVRGDWRDVFGIGYSASLNLKIQRRQGDIRFYSYDMIYEAGGNI